jgi:hypothetical protein
MSVGLAVSAMALTIKIAGEKVIGARTRQCAALPSSLYPGGQRPEG